MSTLRNWGKVLVLGGLFAAGCSVAPGQTFDASKGPRITALQVPTNRVSPGGVVNLHVIAQSPDDSKLTYRWEATAGTLSDGSVPSPVWTAPTSAFNSVGMVTITARVIDDKGRQTAQQAQIALESR